MAAQIPIDEALVRSLLVDQHGDLAGLPLRRVASGWDNELFRLGEALCVRLPRRVAAAGLVLNERRWLPELARILPLPVPTPVRGGAPACGYPWPWSVVPWFRGVPCDQGALGASGIRELLDFLRALHVGAPDGAPRNPFRGCNLADRASMMAERFARLDCAGAVGTRVRDAWDAALAAAIDVESTWIHGDLHARNVLVDAGRITAVIDWGDVAAGDRATDLACIWMLLPDALERERALRDVGDLSPSTRARARGWAVLFGVVLLDSGLAGDARGAAMGAATLRHVADGP